jgi:hypothetical protein
MLACGGSPAGPCTDYPIFTSPIVTPLATRNLEHTTTRPGRNRVFPGTLVVWDAFAL